MLDVVLLTGTPGWFVCGNEPIRYLSKRGFGLAFGTFGLDGIYASGNLTAELQRLGLRSSQRNHRHEAEPGFCYTLSRGRSVAKYPTADPLVGAHIVVKPV